MIPHNPARLSRLQELAAQCGYGVAYIPTVYRRGWPERSAKPYALYLRNESGACHVASFATMQALESNLRARSGC